MEGSYHLLYVYFLVESVSYDDTMDPLTIIFFTDESMKISWKGKT